MTKRANTHPNTHPRLEIDDLVASVIFGDSADALRQLAERAKDAEDALGRIILMHQYREPEEMPSLAFRMKEVALETLAVKETAHL